MEAVAETSEEYMERYFSGDEFTQEEISSALREHVIEGNIVPVMLGSGINAQGAKMVLQGIDKYFPTPSVSVWTYPQESALRPNITITYHFPPVYLRRLWTRLSANTL